MSGGPADRDRITLTIARGQWMATFDGQYGRNVLALFGTRTIPTAYRSTAPAEVVRAEIAELNPFADVRVAAEVAP